ncbi:hypothetical protein RHMOL_Rhmol05G0318000 [Rhododendron molle]|uniref:Uncharacterized protein n=1 Tax=Rhododendron molle TaxID=49168 RepID=A0ACC0NXE4_RHOML|nr:hypothetical protein RHMOL_Rhmol05G0318000 [Rhododendron molle]
MLPIDEHWHRRLTTIPPLQALPSLDIHQNTCLVVSRTKDFIGKSSSLLSSFIGSFPNLFLPKQVVIPDEMKVAVIPNCSILAVVGQKMASTPGVSVALFNALAKANINVRAIAQGCSEYNITLVVKREDCVRAL